MTEADGKRTRGRPRVFDREAALAKAMKLFWAKGFEPTSIADLTDTMGIGPTSLYAAFGSKDDLYAEALSLYTRAFEHLTLGRFRQAPTAKQAIFAYLHDSAAAMTGAGCGLPHGCMVNLGTVGSNGHEALADLMRNTRGMAFDILVERLRQGVDEGELPPGLDVAKLARYVQTVQSGMAIRARDGATQEELEAVAELALAGWDSIVAGAQ